MNPRLKKFLIGTADVLLGVYVVLGMTAFNKPDQKARVCTRSTINIADEATNGFISAPEIKQRLKQSKLDPLGKPLRYVDTRKIEDMLRRSPFVQTAECYKTQDGEVNITITQRMPVVRIKSDNGDDYYIDDQNAIMPNSHYTSDLIIVTGAVSKWFATRYIAPMSKAIMADKLWSSQIVQINVLRDHGIEIVPRVGNHVVYLGQLPEDNDPKRRQKAIDEFLERKLTRLDKFYRYGLSQAGWNKYSYINLEFDNQIICKRRYDYVPPINE